MAKSLSMRDPLPPVQLDECEVVVINNESTVEELQSAVERIRLAQGPPWYADSRRPVACTSIKPVSKGRGKSIISFLVSKEEWIERYYKARDANVFRVGKRRPIELKEPGQKKYLCVIFDMRKFDELPLEVISLIQDETLIKLGQNGYLQAKTLSKESIDLPLPQRSQWLDLSYFAAWVLKDSSWQSFNVLSLLERLCQKTLPDFSKKVKARLDAFRAQTIHQCSNEDIILELMSMAYVYEFLWATLYMEDAAADAENEKGAMEEAVIANVIKEGKMSQYCTEFMASMKSVKQKEKEAKQKEAKSVCSVLRRDLRNGCLIMGSG